MKDRSLSNKPTILAGDKPASIGIRVANIFRNIVDRANGNQELDIKIGSILKDNIITEGQYTAKVIYIIKGNTPRQSRAILEYAGVGRRTVPLSVIAKRLLDSTSKVKMYPPTIADWDGMSPEQQEQANALNIQAEESPYTPPEDITNISVTPEAPRQYANTQRGNVDSEPEEKPKQTKQEQLMDFFENGDWSTIDLGEFLATSGQSYLHVYTPESVKKYSTPQDLMAWFEKPAGKITWNEPLTFKVNGVTWTRDMQMRSRGIDKSVYVMYRSRAVPPEKVPGSTVQVDINHRVDTILQAIFMCAREDMDEGTFQIKMRDWSGSLSFNTERCIFRLLSQDRATEEEILALDRSNLHRFRHDIETMYNERIGLGGDEEAARREEQRRKLRNEKERWSKVIDHTKSAVTTSKSSGIDDGDIEEIANAFGVTPDVVQQVAHIFASKIGDKVDVDSLWVLGQQMAERSGDEIAPGIGATITVLEAYYNRLKQIESEIPPSDGAVPRDELTNQEKAEESKYEYSQPNLIKLLDDCYGADADIGSINIEFGPVVPEDVIQNIYNLMNYIPSEKIKKDVYKQIHKSVRSSKTYKGLRSSIGGLLGYVKLPSENTQQTIDMSQSKFNDPQQLYEMCQYIDSNIDTNSQSLKEIRALNAGVVEQWYKGTPAGALLPYTMAIMTLLNYYGSPEKVIMESSKAELDKYAANSKQILEGLRNSRNKPNEVGIEETNIELPEQEAQSEVAEEAQPELPAPETQSEESEETQPDLSHIKHIRDLTVRHLDKRFPEWVDRFSRKGSNILDNAEEANAYYAAHGILERAPVMSANEIANLTTKELSAIVPLKAQEPEPEENSWVKTVYSIIQSLRKSNSVESVIAVYNDQGISPQIVNGIYTLLQGGYFPEDIARYDPEVIKAWGSRTDDDDMVSL